MKQNVCHFLITLSLILGISACSDNDNSSLEETAQGITYMGITLSLPAQIRTRAVEDQDYNSVGEYSGVTEIKTLDIYLLSSDGNNLLENRRFTSGEYSFSSNADGSDAIRITTPFKTTPGNKRMIVIINSPEALLPSAPSVDYLYSLSTSLPLSQIAQVDYGKSTTTSNGVAIYADVLTLSGSSEVFSIEDGVTAQEVTSNGKNLVTLDVTRIPSRAIVTSSAPVDVTNTNGVKLGLISDVTYSVAQGANAVYLFPQTNTNGTTKTWGYDYVPGPEVLYTTTASKYYDYSDLSNLTDAVPAKPSNGSQITLPGKFLLESTHKSAADLSSTMYRKGNTAYILIRAVFTPDPAQIADGGTLTDGTFYIGGTDGKIYSSIENAQDYNIGIQNQPVATYTNGKVLYFIWLNPDNIQKPINSPVVRNNIYHVNINSFKSIGVNWNPLVPRGPSNPNPRPTGPEPENPIKPTDPLSTTDTYMSVDITVLNWHVHTYDIDL
ncbi:Mfa1 family fimbria major subunit [Bacteroides reticulotermitis]|nr:Mfa1 family fimbria major subunit [Bacteroides reticulotermitis]MBB4045305.1 hypothetical protein [Bacteroides reticulotermitis]